MTDEDNQMKIAGIAIAACTMVLGGCATISPVSRIESNLIKLGMGEPRAECLANELGDELDRNDLNDVADFLGDLNDASSAGGAFEALLAIGNPRAAAAIAVAGIACAISR